jgi:methylmalonyl-CoA mutase N-terminal domain/subunit
MVQLYIVFCLREHLNKLNKQQASENNLNAQEIPFNDIRTTLQALIANDHFP